MLLQFPRLDDGAVWHKYRETWMGSSGHVVEKSVFQVFSAECCNVRRGVVIFWLIAVIDIRFTHVVKRGVDGCAKSANNLSCSVDAARCLLTMCISKCLCNHIVIHMHTCALDYNGSSKHLRFSLYVQCFVLVQTHLLEVQKESLLIALKPQQCTNLTQF